MPTLGQEYPGANVIPFRDFQKIISPPAPPKPTHLPAAARPSAGFGQVLEQARPLGSPLVAPRDLSGDVIYLFIPILCFCYRASHAGESRDSWRKQAMRRGRPAMDARARAKRHAYTLLKVVGAAWVRGTRVFGKSLSAWPQRKRAPCVI